MGQPSNAAATADAPAPAAATPSLPMAPSALIVGGGPAGLAAALQLSSRGWRDVVVLERRDSVMYADTDRSYVYAIDGRGRRLLERHGLGGALEAAGVSTEVVSLVRVGPDGRKEQRQQAIKDPTRTTHWLPRPAFVGLLADALAAPAHAANVAIVTGAAVTAIRRTPDGVEADVEITSAGGAAPERATLSPRLLVGADGAGSAVRSALEEWAAADAALATASGSFRQVSVLPCPSAGLRFKVLPLPPAPALKDGTRLDNSSFALLQGREAPSVGGKPIRLGLLPFRDPDAPRTANLITEEGHPIWEVTDGEAMYRAFEEALPQADWRALVPSDVMAKFAASRGGSFPAPTYSDGAGAALGGGAAAVLLGDALHCFPPDLGQGVNSALLDVLALDEALAANTPAAEQQQQQQQQQQAAGAATEGFVPGGVDIAAAAAAYHASQGEQAAALCQLLPIGFPLQYFNSLRRRLWNVVFLSQLALSKLLPFLMPPPTFMMVQDASLDYATILVRARRAQAVGRAIALALAVAVAGAVARLVLRGGAAAAGLAA